MPDNINLIKTRIRAAADLCVKCGLCSAQCPTYQLSGSENDSPRGRIALAQALASNKLSINKQLESHLQSCLNCYRCQKICPSGVKYDEVITKSRSLLHSNYFKKIVVRRAALLTHNQWKLITSLLKIPTKLGLFKLIPQLKYLQSGNLSHVRNTKGTDQKSVMLFTGCTSHVLDSRTLQTAKKLLNLCGYRAIIPNKQVCCGAMPFHKGYIETAEQCDEQNQRAFAAKDIPIVNLASACGAHLNNYGKPFNNRTVSITRFLLENADFKKLTFAHEPKRVVIYIPCSEKNVENNLSPVEDLLTILPNITINKLDEKTSCCGAAGDYMITHANNANRIRERSLKDIIDLEPDIVVTTNYTCGIHIRNGLKQLNLDIDVMHPIELIYNSIDAE